jgi:hypothetical protein
VAGAHRKLEEVMGFQTWKGFAGQVLRVEELNKNKEL